MKRRTIEEKKYAKLHEKRTKSPWEKRQDRVSCSLQISLIISNFNIDNLKSADLLAFNDIFLIYCWPP